MTRVLSYDFCKQEALKYKTLKEIDEKDHSVYQKIKRMEWNELLSHMVRLTGYMTRDYCKSLISNYKYLKNFRLQNPSAYEKVLLKGWQDLLEPLQRLHTKHTIEECSIVASQYWTRLAFIKGSHKIYEYARIKGWLDAICEHMGDRQPSGLRKPDFIRLCEKNNNGLGILYLIKCWGNGETFYKIGRTSRSVRDRCYYISRSVYDCEIIWEIQGDPSQIYDIEYHEHRESKPYRYQPEHWETQSRECFKCHGNCKILRKPALVI